MTLVTQRDLDEIEVNWAALDARGDALAEQAKLDVASLVEDDKQLRLLITQLALSSGDNLLDSLGEEDYHAVYEIYRDALREEQENE